MSYLLFLFIVFIVVGSILSNLLYVDENRWRLVEYDSQYFFHHFPLISLERIQLNVFY